MTHDELWHRSCEAVVKFVKTNERRPSKYYAEERSMHNWLKYNHKLARRNALSPARLERFAELERLLSDVSPH